ncbi:hypothetical protein RCZ15_13780 [Capnocytophaga catalasegens]|uniref:Uncharacterized protein n=1 Tax=Capnocytophaga catalasegens TaxID=1004260 RepID=A0AAV5AXB6_9FLAO|nr:hypothetical protein RCZ03_02260 [Capnocytophaga catalasegens]GJM50405.1 hypothetical protein RCZ15_13780 [Capnocytophaga catalasegens]GJM52688.1 hypothetical protein RCZ16_10050 [Capnocytophaga catalasegens]
MLSVECFHYSEKAVLFSVEDFRYSEKVILLSVEGFHFSECFVNEKNIFSKLIDCFSKNPDGVGFNFEYSKKIAYFLDRK